MKKDVVVFLDIYDDRAKAINQGLLVEGHRVARFLGGGLTAIIEEPSGHGEHSWVQSAKMLLETEPFRVFLFAHTDKGGERAALLSRALNSTAVTDCFDIRFRKDTLYYARYVHGCQFEQEACFADPPEIVSLSVEFLEARPGFAEELVPLKNISLKVPESADAKKTIAKIPPDFKTTDIRYAKRVLDIGTGCGRQVLLEKAEELSGLLEASLGATRLVVDNGSIPKTRMIGQTGKMVSPELCLTLGVSGSPHHIAGMQQAGTILSVNSDERAPVFGISDAGFIADLNALLPKLIRRIKQYRDEELT